MKPLPPAKLLGATVALLCSACSGLIVAQTPANFEKDSSVETAMMALPEAPMLQAAPAVAGASAAPSATDASSSAQQPGVSNPSGPAAPAIGPVADPAACSVTPVPAEPDCKSGASAAPAATAPVDARQQQREQAEHDLKMEEKQRLLGVMPQFQVVMNGTAVPLTGGQKWRLALHSAIDPFYIGWAFVIGGGYGELVGNNNGYGWATEGYFKRVGANYADNVNGALIGNALLPTLLHQDPRYFRKGTGPIFKRFLYAAESTVVCKGDNGKWQPNVSNVLGNYLSGAISNAYYPANERGVALTLENGTSVTLFGALGGQILEFGPDLARLVHHHHTPPAAAPVTVTPAAAGTPAPPPETR